MSLAPKPLCVRDSLLRPDACGSANGLPPGEDLSLRSKLEALAGVEPAAEILSTAKPFPRSTCSALMHGGSARKSASPPGHSLPNLRRIAGVEPLPKS